MIEVKEKSGIPVSVYATCPSAFVGVLGIVNSAHVEEQGRAIKILNAIIDNQIVVDTSNKKFFREGEEINLWQAVQYFLDFKQDPTIVSEEEGPIWEDDVPFYD